MGCKMPKSKITTIQIKEANLAPMKHKSTKKHKRRYILKQRKIVNTNENS